MEDSPLEIHMIDMTARLYPSSALHAAIIAARRAIQSQWPSTALVPGDVCVVEFPADVTLTQPYILNGMSTYARVASTPDRTALIVPLPLSAFCVLSYFPATNVPPDAVRVALWAMRTAL